MENIEFEEIKPDGFSGMGTMGNSGIGRGVKSGSKVLTNEVLATMSSLHDDYSINGIYAENLKNSSYKPGSTDNTNTRARPEKNMKIKITLTDAEFDLIDKIKNNRITATTAEALAEKLIDIGLVHFSRYYSLTNLGHLAWEQNKPKEAKVEKPTDEAFKACIAYWLKEYHPGWTFGAIHGKAMKSILAKIRTAQPRTDATTIIATFKKLCQSLPEWFKDKDLPVINSKFNEIITQIQRGPNKGGWNQMNSAERLFGEY
jgi:hypothetical protein